MPFLAPWCVALYRFLKPPFTNYLLLTWRTQLSAFLHIVFLSYAIRHGYGKPLETLSAFDRTQVETASFHLQTTEAMAQKKLTRDRVYTSDNYSTFFRLDSAEWRRRFLSRTFRTRARTSSPRGWLRSSRQHGPWRLHLQFAYAAT